MATFAAAFTVQQSADCKTLTLTDTSNYITNTQAYTTASFVTREFKLYNSLNVLVATLTMTGTDLDVTYALTEDQWLKADLNLYLIGNTTTTPDFTVTHSILSTCFLKLCFSELVAESECGCGCSGGSCGCADSTCNDTVRLLQYIKASEIFAEYSNAVSAQRQLDAGTALCEANHNK